MPFKDPAARHAYQRKYRQDHKVEISKRTNEWLREHAEHVKDSRRQYHQDNKEQRNEVNRQYDHDHRAERNENKRVWREEHPVERSASDQRWRQKYPVNAKLIRINSGAKRRGCIDKLTLEQLCSLLVIVGVDTQTGLGGVCPHCNCSFKPRTKQRWSLDHILAIELGGRNLVENCQILCVLCNSKKGLVLSGSLPGAREYWCSDASTSHSPATPGVLAGSLVSRLAAIHKRVVGRA